MPTGRKYISENPGKTARYALFILAPLIALYLIIFVELDAKNPTITYTLAVAIIMAIWWVTKMGSLAFMLPVATPFGSKRITVIRMVKTGFVLNLIEIIIVSIIIYYFGTLIFDNDEGVYPEWGQIAN